MLASFRPVIFFLVHLKFPKLLSEERLLITTKRSATIKERSNNSALENIYVVHDWRFGE